MYKTFLAIVIFCLGVLLGTEAVHAAPDSILSDFSFRRWRSEDGLNENIVNGVEQSRDGLIWCVTQNQLLRFDGERFSPANERGWPSGTFGWRGLSVDRRGGLWLYGSAGVLMNEGHGWTSFPKIAGSNNAGVSYMEEDPKGVMWGMGKEGLYRFDGSQPVLFPCVIDGSPLEVTDMDVAPDGEILIVADGQETVRLLSFRNGVYTQESLPPEYSSEVVLKVHAGPSGNVWVATNKHLLCQSQGEWRAVPLPEDQSDWAGIRTMLEGQDGDLWVGTVRGLFRWSDDQWSELTTHDGIFPFTVRFLKEDREGGLWVAGTGGLMRLTPKAIHTFISGSGLENEPFVSLLVSGTQWWAGIAGTKPLVGTPGSFHSATVPSFPDNTTASALLKATDGSLWIGTHSDNLWHWNGNKAEMILPKQDSDVSSAAVTALLQDRSGKIWVGTLGGLLTVSSERLAPAEASNPSDTVNTIYEDNDGTIWVGYQTLGLMKVLRNGSSVWFRKEEGLPDDSVRTIYRDKAGVLWIGTSSGLVRWVKNRQNIFTAAQGLVDDAIRQIIEDDFGYLWLGTRSGLMRINQSDFTQVESGAKATLAVRCFGNRDGMKNEECTGAHPVKTPDGKLWFPTADGLAMVDPKELPKTTEAPLIYLDSVRVGRQQTWSFDPLNAPKSPQPILKLPTRARDITFRFSSIDYFAPERVLFKYKVDGMEEDWSAPTSARAAHFNTIPPGKYRFRVQACSRDGVWSVAESSVAFSVPPRFWQTVWFRAGAAVVAISMAALMFVRSEQKKSRQKVRKLEHEQALERERTRIARDIHDQVGAGLTEVALLSELAQVGSQGPQRKHLDNIFKTARDLTRSLDEIVWSINPANDSLKKLVFYLVEFSRDFLNTASLPCRLDVPTELPPVTVESKIRHNICQAVRETLNNVVKHAEASEVRLEIAWLEGRLRITIKDNGRGFARAAVSDPAATRDGLNNIAARMREIGGCCEQQSGIGQGTRTALSVEIPTVLRT